MVTLTLILIAKFIYGLLHNKPAGVRLGGNVIISNLVGLKVVAKIAKQILFKSV